MKKVFFILLIVAGIVPRYHLFNVHAVPRLLTKKLHTRLVRGSVFVFKVYADSSGLVYEYQE